MGRLEQIITERQQDMNVREAELLLNWRVQLVAAALPYAQQEHMAISGERVERAAKLAMEQADAVMALILAEISEG